MIAAIGRSGLEPTVRTAAVAALTDSHGPNAGLSPEGVDGLVSTARGDGDVIEGILTESDAGSIVIVRAGGERRTVPRGDIDVLHSSGRSLMPEGFGRLLAPTECADLVAFLRGGRPVPPAAASVSMAAVGAVAQAAAEGDGMAFRREDAPGRLEPPTRAPYSTRIFTRSIRCSFGLNVWPKKPKMYS